MITTVKKYLSLVKFSHTIFAMPFALIGFVLGLIMWKSYSFSVTPGWHTTVYPPWMVKSDIPGSSLDIILRFVLVIFSMVFARSAAMAFNRWADARWDAQNPRTAIREIPKGIITAKNALAFVI